MAHELARLPRCWSLRLLGRFKRIGFVTSFKATFGLTRSIWGLGRGRTKGKKQSEKADRTNRRRTKKRMAAERTARRDKYRRSRKRSNFLFTFLRMRKSESGDRTYGDSAASPTAHAGVSCSDHSAGSSRCTVMIMHMSSRK